MVDLDDERMSQEGDLVFDDEPLDDFAPTRVTLDPRALAAAAEQSFRPAQVRVGDVLARKYRVERVHKRGALGVTVEAVHTQLGQRVAIRLLAADPRAYPEAATRFLHGARLAVQFQNEHTARITDVGTLETGSPYIVAEFLSGTDLQRVLRVREWLGVPEAVDYLLQACEALSEAHAHEVVHRNLKPTNLFVTRRGAGRRLVVLDFGVSEDPLTDAAINLGGISSAGKSLAYLAPEQIREPGNVDARADIWALGAILHEMLTGCALYDAQTTPGLLAMIAADPAVPVSHLRPEIPAELESVVLRCVAKDKEGRYPSVAELASALRPFASADGLQSVERVSKTFGVRSRSTRPPPLPGQMTRAIVRVPQPPKRVVPPPSQVPPPSRRFVELGLTGLGLAAAGALGAYIAIHAMEGALVAAVAPRAVVADLSPALPTPPAPQVASATRVELAPNAGATAPSPLASTTPAPPAMAHAQPAPDRAVALAIARSPVQSPPPRTASPHRSSASEASVVADAKPPTHAQGLFDDAN